MVAWKVLSVDTREIFRTTISVDDATWARAHGWANAVLVREAHRWLAEAFAS